jgi:hypothetical protein
MGTTAIINKYDEDEKCYVVDGIDMDDGKELRQWVDPSDISEATHDQ